MNNVERYLSHLGMTEEDIRGKFILDIGSGFPGFAHECINRGIAEVLSLDRSRRDFGLPEKYLGSKSEFFDITPIVIAQAEGLPFSDDAFDLVIAHASVPLLCQTKKSVSDVIEAMIRVSPDVRIVPIVIKAENARVAKVNSWIEEKLSALANDDDCEIERRTVSAGISGIPGRFMDFNSCRIRKVRK